MLAPFAACSTQSTALAIDAGEDSISDAAAEVSTREAGHEAGPTYDEDGWVRLDFDSTTDCGFYAATSPGQMPARIEWEPCTNQARPLGLACRQILFNWPAPAGPFAAYPYMGFVGGGYSSGVGATLAVSRITGNRIYRLIADADGPVHGAIVERNADCTLGSQGGLRDGRVVYTATRSKGIGFASAGAIGGGIDEVPRVLRSEANTGQPFHSAFYAGADAFFEWGPFGLFVWDWAAAQKVTLSFSDPGDLYAPAFQGNALTFQLGNAAYSRIKVYIPNAGLLDLVSYGNDVSHNAVDFGTDGNVMVWVEGIGRASSADPFTTIQIMTAPFTTDAGTVQVQKRRLRSESPGDFGSAPFVVGCGYAAHEFLTSGVEQGVRIVRLADGRSWRLATGPGPFHWLLPVAITCDEVFMNFVLSGTFNLGRVRLDSLGPGDPPD